MTIQKLRTGRRGRGSEILKKNMSTSLMDGPQSTSLFYRLEISLEQLDIYISFHFEHGITQKGLIPDIVQLSSPFLQTTFLLVSSSSCGLNLCGSLMFWRRRMGASVSTAASELSEPLELMHSEHCLQHSNLIYIYIYIYIYKSGSKITAKFNTLCISHSNIV